MSRPHVASKRAAADIYAMLLMLPYEACHATLMRYMLLFADYRFY